MAEVNPEQEPHLPPEQLKSLKAIEQTSTLLGVVGLINNMAMLSEGEDIQNAYADLAQGFSHLVRRIRRDNNPLPELEVFPGQMALNITTEDLKDPDQQ